MPFWTGIFRFYPRRRGHTLLQKGGMRYDRQTAARPAAPDAAASAPGQAGTARLPVMGPPPGPAGRQCGAAAGGGGGEDHGPVGYGPVPGQAAEPDGRADGLPGGVFRRGPGGIRPGNRGQGPERCLHGGVRPPGYRGHGPPGRGGSGGLYGGEHPRGRVPDPAGAGLCLCQPADRAGDGPVRLSPGPQWRRAAVPLRPGHRRR